MMEYVHYINIPIIHFIFFLSPLHLPSLPTSSSSAQKLQRKSNFFPANAFLQSQLSKHIFESNYRQNFSQKFSKVNLERFSRKKFSKVNSTVMLCSTSSSKTDFEEILAPNHCCAWAEDALYRTLCAHGCVCVCVCMYVCIQRVFGTVKRMMMMYTENVHIHICPLSLSMRAWVYICIYIYI